MHKRTERLHQIMAQNKLNADQVAALLNRSATTVKMWRCRTGPRTIPADTLRLLEMMAIEWPQQ